VREVTRGRQLGAVGSAPPRAACRAALEPAYWGLVFPIGMYGAATFRMRAALSLDTLEVVPEVTLVMAIAAWSSAFAGLLHHLATNVVALRRELRC
jgi:tellurite resistance protein TehA-like permease